MLKEVMMTHQIKNINIQIKIVRKKAKRNSRDEKYNIGVPHFIVIHCNVLQRYRIFYKLKVCAT